MSDGPTRRETLLALREKLLSALADMHKPGCPCECGPAPDARQLAALAREIRAVVAEIDALPPAEETGISGDLRNRVADVRARSTGNVHPPPG
jgi:hypothetical protein